jgi:hypothetical protein
MKVRLISPFDDAEQIWIGLDEPDMRRKVFRFVSPETGSEEFMAGITIFEPGESSSYHVHPESEEINLVIGGSGGRVEGERRSAPGRDVGPGRLPPAQAPGPAPAALRPPAGSPAEDQAPTSAGPLPRRNRAQTGLHVLLKPAPDDVRQACADLRVLEQIIAGRSPARAGRLGADVIKVRPGR